MTRPLVPEVPESFDAATFFVDRHLAEGWGERVAFRYRVELVEGLPKTATGKLQRFRLRAGEVASTRS